MIKSFSCSNFRNIDIKDLRLSKINLFIGPNNAGKTNLIKALTFYSNMLKHSNEGNEDTDFLNAVARHGWGHALNSHKEDGNPISFEWNMNVGNKPIVYKFEYITGKEKADFRIVLEEMTSGERSDKYEKPFNYFRAHDSKEGAGQFSTAIERGTENKRVPFSLSFSESICSQFNTILLKDSNVYNYEYVRKDILDLFTRLADSFRSFYSYSSSQFDTKAMRKAADEKEKADYLKTDASNFANVYQRMRNNSLIWKSEYIKNMQTLMRRVTEIETIPESGNLKMRLVDNGKEYDLSDVSEGTLKALAWNLLFTSSDMARFGLLAIDEPENNLHPAWQKNVGEWILRSNSFEQCIISTHSPDFLDVFTDSFRESGDVAVYAFDGQGRIRRIDYDEIREDMGDWLLGDLYRCNDPAIGGWPW